jgi:hypothetical protein
MIHKDNILKSVLGLFTKGGVSYDKKFTDPRRDWFIGLLVFLVIVVAGGVYSAQMFVTYRSLNTDGGDYDDSLVRYNKSLIEEVLAVYEARKESFDTLKEKSTPIVNVPPVVPEPTTTASTSKQVTQDLEVSSNSSTEPVPIEELEMAI